MKTIVKILSLLCRRFGIIPVPAVWVAICKEDAREKMSHYHTCGAPEMESYNDGRRDAYDQISRMR